MGSTIYLDNAMEICIVKGRIHPYTEKTRIFRWESFFEKLILDIYKCPFFKSPDILLEKY